MNLLFISLIALFMSHELMNSSTSARLNKKNKNKKPKRALAKNADANVGAKQTLQLYISNMSSFCLGLLKEILYSLCPTFFVLFEKSNFLREHHLLSCLHFKNV